MTVIVNGRKDGQHSNSISTINNHPRHWTSLVTLSTLSMGDNRIANLMWRDTFTQTVLPWDCFGWQSSNTGSSAHSLLSVRPRHIHSHTHTHQYTATSLKLSPLTPRPRASFNSGSRISSLLFSSLSGSAPASPFPFSSLCRGCDSSSARLGAQRVETLFCGWPYPPGVSSLRLLHRTTEGQRSYIPLKNAVQGTCAARNDTSLSTNLARSRSPRRRDLICHPFSSGERQGSVLYGHMRSRKAKSWSLGYRCRVLNKQRVRSNSIGWRGSIARACVVRRNSGVRAVVGFGLW